MNSAEHYDNAHELRDSKDEISFGDLFDAALRQRVPILLSLLVCGAAGALILALMLALVPSSVLSELPFRIKFAGVTEGNYPNGTPFQPGDIVSPSVVRPLFDRLELGNYFGFEELKASITVVESNPEMDRLRREFEAKLANTRLTQAERDEMEKDYAARRSAARTGEFRVQLISGGGVPSNVAEALLPAVLESWAAEAQNVRGAWLYDVPVPGQGLLSQSDLVDEDYLVVVDLLRLTLKRVDRALEALSNIPGANLVRVPGDDGLSIVEARARLEDLRQFKIEPLFAQVYGQGIFRDRAATTRYLEHRLFRLQLDANALANKGKAIESVLERNASSRWSVNTTSDEGVRAVVIPQFGDSFMDRLMEVGAQTADVKFRRELSKDLVKLRSEMVDLELEQSLYQALLKGFSAVPEISAGIGAEESSLKRREEVRKAVEERFAAVTAECRFLIDQLQGLHKIISEQNLHPHNIYATTGPTRTSRTNSLGLRQITGVLAASIFAGCVLAFLVAWRRERVSSGHLQ